MQGRIAGNRATADRPAGSTGHPGRRYKCGDRPRDTVIWDTNEKGKQIGRLKPAYRDLLTDFSNRFVAGFDYGPANRNSAEYLRHRIANIRLILSNLPEPARHDIGYRTGWKLLTSKVWQ